MDAETTPLAYETIAIIIRPLLTTEDIVQISRREGGDDIEFSAETVGQIANVDVRVRGLLNNKEAYPLVNAYKMEEDELKRHAEETDTTKDEKQIENWRAIRDKQKAIAEKNLQAPNSSRQTIRRRSPIKGS
jgi:hypothetical protein